MSQWICHWSSCKCVTVEEERPMRDPAHQMIAPPRLELPLLSHFARSISPWLIAQRHIHCDIFIGVSHSRTQERNHFFTYFNTPGNCIYSKTYTEGPFYPRIKLPYAIIDNPKTNTTITCKNFIFFSCWPFLLFLPCASSLHDIYHLHPIFLFWFQPIRNALSLHT